MTVLASSAGVAAADSGWSLQPTPNPVGTASSLLGVSCTSSSACTAVGLSESTSVPKATTLAERWNGSTWEIQPTPDPAGTTSPVLRGVSCTSPSACTAVGFAQSATGVITTLAERWNGSTWEIQPTPNPVGSSISLLYGVSCTSSSTCIATGEFDSQTLAERWDGRTWEILPTPNPSATFNEFRAVSCTSANACTAVGDYSASTAVQTLAERWNGRNWEIQPTPSPAAAGYSTLLGVSCAKRRACTAVGTYFDRTGAEFMLAEGSHRSTWEIQPIANPADATRSSLSGVSCLTRRACTAVGSYDTSPPGTGTAFAGNATLAERSHGSSWEIQPTPNPATTTTINLAGVSCATLRTCTAVGVNGIPSGVTLAEGFSSGT